MENKENLLQVQGLCQYFGNTRAVDDVSFFIRKGEVFGLVGESGCGKSTTGRSIIGLYDITRGDIYFDGCRIAGGTRRQRRKLAKNRKRATDIQMIFQDPVASLNPRMTVEEIIAEGLVIQGVRDKALIHSRVLEILELVGLRPEHAGRYPHEFSGGQRQRIGIARAVIMEPKLLIADEPVSALDVSIQAQVINLLGDLRKKLGLTILFIAHDLSVVKYFSDRIGVMYRGKLVELAEAEELFQNPLHPYTKALLSAIPIPDPRAEKRRERLHYDSREWEDPADMPKMREIKPEHWVYCNEKIYRGMEN